MTMRSGDIVRTGDGEMLFINGIKIKIHNRRITCRKLSSLDGKSFFYYFTFKRYMGGRDIRIQNVNMSQEALCAMFDAFCFLNQDDTMKIMTEFPKWNMQSILRHLKSEVDKEAKV